MAGPWLQADLVQCIPTPQAAVKWETSSMRDCGTVSRVDHRTFMTNSSPEKGKSHGASTEIKNG